MTTYLDDSIANVTVALQEAGLWNNTVFIFSSGKRCHFNCSLKYFTTFNHDTIEISLKCRAVVDSSFICSQSDNGGAEEYGSDNSPFRSGRGSYFNGGIRGPAFVTSSLLFQTGVEHTGILHVSDWMPTLVNLAGGKC